MKIFQTIDPITKRIKNNIHCPKQKQFVEYVNKYLKYGYNWSFGNRDINKEYWNVCEENTLLIIYEDKKELAYGDLSEFLN